MFKALAVIILGSSLLAGCVSLESGQAQMPVAAPYPATAQQKMQAAHHWSILAGHEAQGLLDAPLLEGVPLYIQESAENTPFADAFKPLLTSALVSNGGLVQLTPKNGAEVTHRVSLVDHEEVAAIDFPASSWTRLNAVIAVAALPSAIYRKLFKGNWTDETDFEIVITTQATKNDYVLYSSSNIYYIKGSEREHYSAQTTTDGISLSDGW